jgi:hydroxymethylbilane synthase
VPLAAYAIWDQEQMSIRSFVASVDGKAFCLATAQGAVANLEDAEALGFSVAQDLIAQGAASLLPNGLPQ